MNPAARTRRDHSMEQYISESYQGQNIDEVGITTEQVVIQHQGDEHGHQAIADPVNLLYIKVAEESLGPTVVGAVYGHHAKNGYSQAGQEKQPVEIGSQAPIKHGMILS